MSENTKKSYTVVIPWFGVKKGDIVKYENLPATIKANVVPTGDASIKSHADLLAKAEEEAKAIVDDATASAVDIKAKAEEEAKKIIEAAAGSQKGDLTTSTKPAAKK